MVPEGRERIWKTGIYLGLKGDYYSSLHILCPQIENFFRCVAKECGDIVVTLDDDGTSQKKALSTVLDLPHLNECYDPNIIFTFKALLDEKTGANLRNLVAHGIMNEKDANSGIDVYLLCVAIKLIALASNKIYELYDTSERLRRSLSLKYEGSI